MSWNGILFEKLEVAQLVKKFAPICALYESLPWTIAWASPSNFAATSRLALSMRNGYQELFPQKQESRSKKLTTSL